MQGNQEFFRKQVIHNRENITGFMLSSINKMLFEYLLCFESS